MNNRIIFWIWLQQCFGMGKGNTKRVFEVFESPEQIYLADEKELRASKVFTKKMIEKMLPKDLSPAKKIYQDCQKLGYQIYSLFDEEYPKRLKELKDAPLVLYAEGDMSYINQSLCIAMVGSRQSTPQSQKNAFSISKGLAAEGKVVVSGGAQGVDTFAHMGAIVCDGRTVCVLGGGINETKSVNQELRNEMVKKGTVISEYPPYMPANNYTFLHRDRIIAGMSDCTVVVQAAEKSGTMATARRAEKEKRVLLVVPGRIGDIRFNGSNGLIIEGYSAVITHKDVLELYDIKTGKKPDPFVDERQKMTEEERKEDIRKKKEHLEELTRQRAEKHGIWSLNDTDRISEFLYLEEGYERRKKNRTKKKNLSEELTEEASKVYDTISDVPVDVDGIIDKTGMAVQKVTASLTELEIAGLVKCISGNRYIRK